MFFEGTLRIDKKDRKVRYEEPLKLVLVGEEKQTRAHTFIYIYIQMRLLVRFDAPFILQSIELVHQGNFFGNGNAIPFVAFPCLPILGVNRTITITFAIAMVTPQGETNALGKDV